MCRWPTAFAKDSLGQLRVACIFCDVVHEVMNELGQWIAVGRVCLHSGKWHSEELVAAIAADGIWEVVASVVVGCNNNQRT